MRVLHVHWTALPVTGGVEVHCAAVTGQLATLGVDVELLSGTRDAELGRYHAALDLGAGEPTAAQLDELVAECRAADVVHWHNPQWHRPAVAEAVAARLAGSPGPRVVFDLHNLDERDDHWRFLGRLSDRHVAHSEFVAGQLRSALPGTAVDVLPLALDRTPAPYRLPRAARTVVLQPTRLTTWKGSDLSLRAVTDLLDGGADDVAFAHAGTRNLVWPSNIPGELMARVEPWRERGLISFVHYSPAQSWSAIEAADLVVHPTADRGAHGEPFSLSVAQAVMCGRPVVASESGHLPALLAGYSAARLVPPGDQRALTDAVTEVVRGPRIVADRPGDRELAARLADAFATAGARHLEFYLADGGGLRTPAPSHASEGAPMPIPLPTPIILDCDPGHDDAIAILLAAGSERIDLRAVTTVAGNHTVEKSTLNARRMLSLAGVTGVPVAAGHSGPLLGEHAAPRGDRYSGPDVHGDSGLDGWDFDEPTVPRDGRSAVELMVDVLTAAAEPVTIVATGPQTNVAMLLLTAPHVRPLVREIVCMGGSTHRGNFLPYSEANVLFDPEAASIVLDSGIPITYCGLNATHQALVTADVLAAIEAVPRIGEPAAALLRFRSRTYDRIWDMPDSPLHDPVALSMVIDPSLVRCQEANVAVELRGELTRGATVIDLAGVTDRKANARVAIELDSPRFWDLLINTLHRLGRSGPGRDSS